MRLPGAIFTILIALSLVLAACQSPPLTTEAPPTNTVPPPTPRPARPTPTTTSSILASNNFGSQSPNGLWIAIVEVTLYSEEDYARLTLSRSDGTEWTLYEEWSPTGLGDSFLSQLFWSADGRYLYFTHEGSTDGCGNSFTTNLRRVNLSENTVEDIPLSGLRTDLATISPGAEQVAYRVDEGFLVRDLGSGATHLVGYAWPVNEEYYVEGFAWSPDGSELAFTLLLGHCVYPADPTSSIHLINLATGETRIVTDHDERSLYVAGWPEEDLLRVYWDESAYLLNIETGELTPAE